MIRRLLLLLCFLSHLSLAQPLPRQQFLKQFGPAEGLAQPFIYALAQDRAGYLWLGTAEGLVRFDGTTFQTFTTQEGLAENFVTRLHLDARTGQLWVGHFQGGVSVSQGQRFHPAPSAGGKQFRVKGLPAPDTVAIGRFRRRYYPTLPAETVISAVLRDAEGNFWLGTAGQGLWRLTDAHLSFSPTPKRLTALAGRGALIVAGTDDGQLGHLLFTPTELVLRFRPELTSGSITTLIPISDWGLIGTNGKGVHHSMLVATDVASLNLTDLPADLHVTTLARSEAKNNFLHGIRSIWVGTIGEGAFQVKGNLIRHYTTASGLLHNDVYAILPDRQGRVWFATHGTGLAVLEASGEMNTYRLVPGGVDATALAQDAAGRVWIGTEGDGLFCYADGRFRQFTTRNSGLASNYCYGLTPTPAGLLVQHRNGLSLGRSTQFTAVSTPNNPIIRDLLPNAAAQLPPADSAVLLASRSGLVRVQLPQRPPAATSAITLTNAEVDGVRQSAGPLPELAPRPHRVTWFFRVPSLAPAGTWQYQYRLRGLHEHWSRPTSTGEADFPRLEAGRYVLEVRTRRGPEGRWTPPVRAAVLRVATPFWRTGWFAALSTLAAGVGIWLFTRLRTATLRRQKLQLETTVRERTTELRRQKAEMEQINADLVVARDAAEASRRAKAQFLANMSHEIRTPMNAVIGLTHLLRNTPVDAEQHEYLTAIQSSSQNLLVIINDILDSSKMEAGKLTLEQVPFRLPELVERVARMFQFATEAKGLYLRTDIAPNVPPALLGDAVRLTQVLVNLVGNAVKFTTRGGVAVRVRAATSPTGENRLQIAVQDTGIGIAPDKLDAIFEDFSQANASTTRQFGGTGLGLSIARNLVELHGGRVWVESQEGVGSTFWVDIPCRPTDEAAVHEELPAVLAPFEPPLRVLVAEDNDLNQLVARKTLEAWNVQVTLAANGRLAVEAARQHSFDAVLLDVQMPEMDGYEAARQLRAFFPEAALPLIGLTASALPEDRALALAAGMNDTLAKPFDPAVLYARLAHYTGRRPGAATPPIRPNPPAPAPPGPRPNWGLLEELAGGNATFVEQVVNTFLTQMPELTAQLGAVTGPELARTAHKLRGQVAYFGVEPLVTDLEALEAAAQQTPDAQPAEVADLVQRIQQQLTALELPLRQRLRQAAP